MMDLPSVLETEPVSPPVTTHTVLTPAWWQRPDHLLAVAATTLTVFLHVCFTPSVGGLWRDEINTINLATLPTWHDLWQFHNQDSFPLLFASTARIWSSYFGAGDDSFRLLGLIIGLAVVAAFWINARLMGLPFPFWSLVLAAANPMIIRYGDSARAYGLGLVFLLLMFGFVWKVTCSQKWRWVVIATVTAVLGVHATYYNAVLLFAICAGGCFVALRERNWRTAFAVVSVGAVAAISLLPYAPMFLHANDWNFLVQYRFTMVFMWERLSEVTGSPFSIGVAIWSVLVLAAIIVAFSAGVFRAPSKHRKLVCFCLIALLVGTLSYIGFLKLLSYHTNPWYYLSLVTFVAICIDPILSPQDGRLHRLIRAVAALLFLAFAAVPTARIVRARHTNLDIVAHELETLAAPEDLILLTRWECGVTLQRYYKGRAPWMTIPPLTDFRFQSHQPIIAQMQAEAPLKSIFAAAGHAMKSGHRVWVVGGLPSLRPGQAPPVLPRVVPGNKSWRGSAAFYSVWMAQTMYFLQQHLTRAQSVTFPDTGPVGPFEDLSVCVIEGRR
jgi:hypothetical protein